MRSFNILHLSDTHFGNPKCSVERASVLTKLLQDIKSQFAGSPPDLIIFSGDLVFGENLAMPMELQFKEAKEWLTNLYQIWDLSFGGAPILFAPGNHDVQRTQITEDQTSWLSRQTDLTAIEDNLKTNSKLWSRILERQDLWWKFVRSIPNQPWNYDESLKLVHGVMNFGNKKIGLIGFNSSWSSSRDKEKGDLWFTRHQFLVGSDAVQETDLRIAVLHHPTSWFNEQEETWLKQKLETGFQLELHGHTHDSWYTASETHIAVHSGASWAGTNCENTYNWIHINQECDTIALNTRKYEDKGVGSYIPAYIPSKYDYNGHVKLPLKEPLIN